MQSSPKSLHRFLWATGMSGCCMTSLVIPAIATLSPTSWPEAKPTSEIAQVLPDPQAILSLTRFRATVNITNQADRPIVYAVVGETEPRSLDKGASVTLRNLPVPTSLLLRANDDATQERLFFSINVAADETAGVLNVTVADENPNDGNTSVYIDTNGKVYVD